MVPDDIASHTDTGTKGRLRLIAGAISGVACLVLVPILYRVAALVSDRLFGPATARTGFEGGQIAPRRWIGGLLVAFCGGAALLLSGAIRSRRRLSVGQYWIASVLLAICCAVAAFLLRPLG
jgi:hypothetical protein